MKTQVCFLLLLVLPLVSAVSGVRKEGTQALVGGWTPIKDPNSAHTKEIGEFAVNEYNKQAKASLKFKSVISGQTQVVAGINYKLVLAAKDGAATNKYEAVVYERAWENFKNLTSFKPITRV